MVQEIRKNPIAFIGLGLLMLVMLTAVVVAAQNPSQNLLATANERTTSTAIKPHYIKVTTSRALAVAFKSEQSGSPLTGQMIVSPLVLEKLPDDFAHIQDYKRRQKMFVRAVLPIVLIENRRIHEQRVLAELLLKGRQPANGTPMYKWLTKLAKNLHVRGDLKNPKVINQILGRLDEIPPALALAQAALESGWGTSRFALEGNSLFGLWTFRSEAGLEPAERDIDATHLVARFPNLRSSVRAYIYNLNIGHAYKEFRLARVKMRAHGLPLQAQVLATHLDRYSQRGKLYVSDLQKLIRSPLIATMAKARLGHTEQKVLVASLDSAIHTD
jgi:Bax protein